MNVLNSITRMLVVAAVVVVVVDDFWKASRVLFFHSFRRLVVYLFVLNIGKTTGLPQQQLVDVGIESDVRVLLLS